MSYDLPRWGDERYDWQGWLPPSAHPQHRQPTSGIPGQLEQQDGAGFRRCRRRVGLRRGLPEPGLETIRRAIPTAARSARASSWAGRRRVNRRLASALHAAAAAGRVGTGPETESPRGASVAGLGGRRCPSGRPRSQRTYEHEQAIAIFDAGGTRHEESVAYTVSRAGSARARPPVAAAAVDDHPRLGRGSSWNGVAWYGYVNKDLRELPGRTSRRRTRTLLRQGHRVVCRNPCASRSAGDQAGEAGAGRGRRCADLRQVAGLHPVGDRRDGRRPRRSTGRIGRPSSRSCRSSPPTPLTTYGRNGDDVPMLVSERIGELTFEAAGWSTPSSAPVTGRGASTVS